MPCSIIHEGARNREPRRSLRRPALDTPKERMPVHERKSTANERSENRYGEDLNDAGVVAADPDGLTVRRDRRADGMGPGLDDLRLLALSQVHDTHVVVFVVAD